jgi:glucosamine 6-phosphate synthetase-like amidotransferase/phosphosugar isomerase protein
MPGDIYEQLLQIPQTQLVELALAGLSRQGEMLAKVVEHVQGQLDDMAGWKACPTVQRIYLVGCGDSYFAALSARFACEQLSGLPTVALESMEFARYTQVPPDSLVFVISSGGEVTMTLEAGRVARQAGIDVIGITTQKDSHLAQEFPCLATLPDQSGGDPVEQVAVILGNFSFSLAALYLTAMHVGQRRGHLDDKTVDKRKAEIRAASEAVKRAIRCSTRVHAYLENVSDEADFYFLGAGPSYGVALFCQAKFFEQAQRPVYGVELEEFAHEQFFLLRPGGDAQVWFIVPVGHSRARALEVMAGCREMGAHVIAVTDSRDDQMREKADLAFPVEATSEMFSPLASVVPGELLGIHALGRWGGGSSFASKRRHLMAISKQLTREG